MIADCSRCGSSREFFDIRTVITDLDESFLHIICKTCENEWVE